MPEKAVKHMMVIKNNRMRCFLRLVIIPLIIIMVFLTGKNTFGQHYYLLISFVAAFFSLLFFICGFEQKKTGTRRMVIIAVMTSLCIVGRFIPLFKPITAITVITAVYLGAESGFLVGSLSALLSNFYFGQGPWTPFQMLAFGIIGLIAGIFSKQLKNKYLLLIYGIAAGIAYSLIMDIWTVLWYNRGFDLILYKAAVLTAVPHIISYSLSNFLFLWFVAKPFGDKLERVKIKYGV